MKGSKYCVTYPYAQELAASTLDLEEFGQVLEQWHTWKGKRFASKTWLARCKRAGWMRALSSQTFVVYLGTSSRDLLTLFPAVFHASRSVQPASEKEPKTNATYGHISSKACEQFGPKLPSLKTSQVSQLRKAKASTQFSTMCCATWRSWVMSQRRDSSQRQKLARPTCENDGSFLEFYATPTAKANQTSPYMMKHPGCRNIAWPTPDVTQRPHEGNVRLLRKGVQNGLPKSEADAMLGRDISKPQGKLGIWPTPTTAEGGKIGQSHPAQLSTSGSPLGRLNPAWVETLMGFPIGWTDLGHLETQ